MMMETSTTITHTSESFPKRIRSVSARIFNITELPLIHHNNNTKRSSCHQQILSTSPTISTDHHNNNIILNPSKWFPRIRNRSSSSASSTFSLVFSNTTTDTSYCNQLLEDDHYDHHLSLENISSELEELYNTTKEEIAYAMESEGSIYYEGDKMTAQSAFESCVSKYDAAMHLFGESANSIKFRFRWEADLHELRCTINSLPQINHSIYD